MDKFKAALCNYWPPLLIVLCLTVAGLARADTTSSYTTGMGYNLALNSTGKILVRGLADTVACDEAAKKWSEDNKLPAAVYRCDKVYDLVSVTWTPEPAGPIMAPPAPIVASDSTLRVRPMRNEPPPTRTDIGSFRLPCRYSHMAFDDPIMFPGEQGASHLHTFAGNRSANFASTTESLLAAGSSTCAGGIANLTSYWWPAVVDPVTKQALVPTGYQAYYKKGYNDHTNAEITIPPNGLRMIGGRSATAIGPPGPYDPVQARFTCVVNGADVAWQASIPVCPAGAGLKLNMGFPNCWDGKNLDSPDHRSHMANARAFNPKRCPASHPKPIPQIEINVTYEIEAGKKYRLASDQYDAALPGGYTFHADLWLAWDEAIKAAFVKNCINAGMDCHDYLLGDGRTLF